MATIEYNDLRQLRAAFCHDCAKRLTDGCRHCDPLQCLIVADQMRKAVKLGYDIKVGRFFLTAELQTQNKPQ